MISISIHYLCPFIYVLQWLLWLKNPTAKTAMIYAKHTKKNPYMPFNTFYGFKPPKPLKNFNDLYVYEI